MNEKPLQILGLVRPFHGRDGHPSVKGITAQGACCDGGVIIWRFFQVALSNRVLSSLATSGSLDARAVPERSVGRDDFLGVGVSSVKKLNRRYIAEDQVLVKSEVVGAGMSACVCTIQKSTFGRQEGVTAAMSAVTPRRCTRREGRRAKERTKYAPEQRRNIGGTKGGLVTTELRESWMLERANGRRDRNAHRELRVGEGSCLATVERRVGRKLKRERDISSSPNVDHHSTNACPLSISRERAWLPRERRRAEEWDGERAMSVASCAQLNDRIRDLIRLKVSTRSKSVANNINSLKDSIGLFYSTLIWTRDIMEEVEDVTCWVQSAVGDAADVPQQSHGTVDWAEPLRSSTKANAREMLHGERGVASGEWRAGSGERGVEGDLAK
ncbi:hypothetical protein DB88DRAFT_529053 [Papiliotrema laurentii]|uniref:Uncharacterized protein n=1 Tax=Papiliotrema laurentii TaxID=5418 RepID=A0AAD9CXD4_PAPLA|nr:hypothetical protein DB88DRAFT_529053 [Papiliotrema laurentii]